MPDRTATALIRVACDPRTGRLRCPGALDVGLRATLFADLILAGRIVSVDRAPTSTGAAETGDRYLDILHDAVAHRPGVAWVRWFRHVHSDRAAIITELVEQDRWKRAGGRLRPTYVDYDPAGQATLVRHVAAVAEFRADAKDGQDAALAMVATICGAVGGRPRPRAVRRDLQPILDLIGVPEDPIRRALQAALTASAITVRRARRGRVTG